ncbi:hypothetical protein TWF694_010084 [Orbilia ellipsospora]|uniref:Rhodopsin domain-containing protein n=1 Tax=Orbilia ellipsospora TaxID=2528407 RepID=A0AAV9X8W5_9PEZI
MVWWIEPRDVVVTEWVFVIIASVFFALRIYIRNRHLEVRKHAFKRSKFKLSDWVICVTLLCFYGSVSCDTIMVAEGFSDERLSLHKILTDPNSVYVRFEKGKLRGLLQVLQFSTLPYYFSLWGVKMYLLVLYYKLVKPTALPKQRIALHVLAVLVALTCIGWVAVNIFWCWPIRRNWDVENPRDTCVAYFATKPYIITVTMHAGTELLIFSFPFSFLHILRRSGKKQFYAASSVFAFGFLGVIVSLGRVAYIFTAGHGAPIISMGQAWAALEQCVGIMICCLPAFKTLIEKGWSKSSGSERNLGEVIHSSLREDDTKGKHPEWVDCERSWENEVRGNWNRRGTIIDPEIAILRVESFEMQRYEFDLVQEPVECIQPIKEAN